jgi:hypothetical protein
LPHHFGRRVSRADHVAYLRSMRTSPTIEVLEATSDHVEVRVSGDAAWLTAAWRVVARAARDPTHHGLRALVRPSRLLGSGHAEVSRVGQAQTVQLQ